MRRSAYLALMRYLRDTEKEEGRTIESFAMEGRTLPGGDVQILLDCELIRAGRRREVNMNKQPKLNMQEAMELMKRIAKEEGLGLTFLKADEGRGGYNYGGSCGDCIMLAPFTKIGADGIAGGFSGERPCDNPVECMLISFFHELSHCKLANELSAERSVMQNELWVSMTGITYAKTKYKMEFSDAAVKWLLSENFSYAKEGGAK